MSFAAPFRRSLIPRTTRTIASRYPCSKRRCFASVTSSTTTPEAPREPEGTREVPMTVGDGGSGTVRPVRQRHGSDRLVFPGAVNSKFTNRLRFRMSDPNEAIETYRVMDTEGQIVDETHGLDFESLKEQTLKMYKSMVTISIMDQIMYDSQRQGRISFYIVNAGEEGIAVGSAAALSEQDVIYAQYREAGVLMYRGYTLEEFMSQCFSNKNDDGKGKNMPIHYGSRRLNFHPISSPLATQLPHAAGAGYALKLEGTPACAVTYFGEGAASEGDFHAALNIAATRGCPTVFICRNNGYAISTPTLEQYKGDGIASRGVGYGIDTIRVDGNDAWAVYKVTKEAREIAIAQKKPVLIEAMSYRVSHHSTSDDSFAYRARVEVEDWKRRDNPITRMRKFMELRNWWDQDKDTQLRTHARKDLLKAFNAAEREKKPAISNLWEDVYDKPTKDQWAQMEEMKDILDRYGEEYDLDMYDGGKGGIVIKK
ncbi:hypothetical protein TWF569_000019 [Orbilia oligospora]|uniref:2-oxoisovalerate dehydrogenase subunit alpha n=1 Tax=Orbilia oligospora TaxID=2813651 RepID=A0A7C8N6D4_ORBOL|nr:hypothetical protein TWF103_002631 [Orbilia oligospora]KAF3084139.1 hypothetical protein TWF706_000842 [Orbilia oligospora]KAF3102029.1 hypothetical protein TWF102_004756 [Orbilia oligospora]KAF3122737.1 hypothetical protein TWF703_001129 [Orbilia oligospora]KAF3128076.1 hypothetical protein TWF594_011796 [Orbilia oligospora]